MGSGRMIDHHLFENQQISDVIVITDVDQAMVYPGISTL